MLPRASLGCLVVLLTVSLAAPAMGAVRPEKYGVGYRTDVPVEMSDGVVLYADVWYPTDLATGQQAKGKFPVLLAVTPYNPAPRRAAVSEFARLVVSRGYVYAVGQARGSWGADGVNCFLCDREKQDGVDFVHWAAQLPESNGSVGLTGGSYGGLNQYFTAARLGPGSPVKAMAPAAAGAFLYRQAEFFGGMPNGTVTTLIAGWGNLAGSASAAELGQQVGAELRSGGDRAFNREWWQGREPAYVIEDVVRSGIPVLVRSTWHDEYYNSSSVEAYSMLQNAWAGRDVWAPMRVGQPVTHRYQLIMSSEGHGGYGSRDPAILAWFDYWLKGIDDGLSRAYTPVKLYEMGSDRWVSAPPRYPAVKDYTRLHLNSDGRLTKRKPTARAGSDRIAWAARQTGAVLQYTSDPLTKGATLVGSPVATVYASSNNTNLELIGELFDVAPDGTAERLTMGAMLGSMRTLDRSRSWFDANGDSTRPFPTFTEAVPVTPGRVTRYDIQFNARMFALKPGHRLRLVLTTQSDLNTCKERFGTTGSTCAFPNEPQLTTLADGVYAVQRNRVSASRLSVPLLRYRSLEAGEGIPSLPRRPVEEEG